MTYDYLFQQMIYAMAANIFQQRLMLSTSKYIWLQYRPVEYLWDECLCHSCNYLFCYWWWRQLRHFKPYRSWASIPTYCIHDYAHDFYPHRMRVITINLRSTSQLSMSTIPFESNVGQQQTVSSMESPLCSGLNPRVFYLCEVCWTRSTKCWEGITLNWKCHCTPQAPDIGRQTNPQCPLGWDKRLLIIT